MPNNENGIIKIADKKSFTERILNANGFHIVRFCAVWSGPCHIMAPVYEEMSMMYKSTVEFFWIDIDESPTLKNEFGVTELPTILFFKNGNMTEHTVGLISKESFRQKISEFIL